MGRQLHFYRVSYGERKRQGKKSIVGRKIVTKYAFDDRAQSPVYQRPTNKLIVHGERSPPRNAGG
jgi:hypothetical protein